MAQPTLSAGIKQLEEELGAMLVRRSSRFHGLTPEGEKVLDWARRMVGDEVDPSCWFSRTSRGSCRKQNASSE